MSYLENGSATSTGSALSEVAGISATANCEAPGYLARQPILDRRGTVFGYELHFHGPIQAPARAPLYDASRGLLDALAIYGVERFTAGTRAFLDCTADMLVDGAWEGLPPANVILEIPAASEQAPRLVRACRTLHQAGFQLAAANFNAAHIADELLALVDFVKVDESVLEGSEWDRVCRRIFGSHATVIAANIHTQDSYSRARALGIRYFQGFYFCNPELIPSGKIPAHRAQQVQILRQLFRDPLDLKTLCPLVMADPSVVYRVLRFVNSPLCAIREAVTSVEAAIMILGDNTFRCIATLAIQCSLSQGQPPELLNMALVRARFCAAAAPMCGLDPDEQYLLGMLSLLPPMLQLPMSSILPQLPLRKEMREALAGTPGKERALLSWIEHLEEDRISGCEAIVLEHNLDRSKLAELYFNALQPDPNLTLTD